MPVSGLVVTFNSAVSNHGDVVESIRAISEIQIGDAHGSKLAIVVDTATRHRDQEIWNRVRHFDGVIDLSVALVAFDDDAFDADTPADDAFADDAPEDDAFADGGGHADVDDQGVGVDAAEPE